MAEAVAGKIAVYDRMMIALHCITATSVVVLWIIGQTADWILDGPANTAYWSVHVVLGFVLAAVLAWRIGWRVTAGRRLPAAVSGSPIRVASKRASEGRPRRFPQGPG